VGAQILKAPRNPMQWYDNFNNWRGAGNKTKVGGKRERHKSAVFQRERKTKEREMCLRGKQNIGSLGRDDKEDRADRARRKGGMSGRQKTKGREKYCQRGGPAVRLSVDGGHSGTVFGRDWDALVVRAWRRVVARVEKGVQQMPHLYVYVCVCICMCT